MSSISRRRLGAIISLLALALVPAAAPAAEALKEIRIVWVQSAGSNKALEYLNAGSIDFGSAAGSAALVARINGNPIKSIYVYSRPEWTALVTTKDSKITAVADLRGKRVAVTRGTDPHIRSEER